MEPILLIIILLGVGIAFMSFNVIVRKDGKFPNTHVSGNKAMRDAGVGCIQSQDRQAQRGSQWAVSERKK